MAMLTVNATALNPMPVFANIADSEIQFVDVAPDKARRIL
jgi:hypothetical protein